MATETPGPASRPAPSSPPLPPQATPGSPPAGPAPASARYAGRGGRLVLVAILGGLVGSLLTVTALGIAGVFSETEASPPTTIATTVPVTVEVPVPIPAGDEAAVALIAERARPSIVTVEVGSGDGADLATGSGSGVVLDTAGHVVTNHHVVEGADFVRVIFPDGRIFQAEVIGADPLTDIAVIEVGTTNLVPITLGDIGSLHIGDPAVAIGNPLGLGGGPSVTSGIVSAFNRQLRVTAENTLYGLIQTDAPITRGSSGGALLDQEGRLIGITTAIGVSDVGAEGLGFAVPVNIAIGVADDLIRDGRVRHAYLGITGDDAFDVTDDNAQVPLGALIFSLEDASAISRAGAQVGDTIVALEGQRVSNMSDLVALLRTRRAGETVDVTVLRDGRRIVLRVELDQRPEGL